MRDFTHRFFRVGVRASTHPRSLPLRLGVDGLKSHCARFTKAQIQMITSHMHVKAPGYPRHLKDDELVNSFMSGFSLAEAIKSELMECGYSDLELVGEDWGWLVVAVNRASNTELHVTVSSMADPDSDQDAVVEAMVGIQPQKLTKGALWWKKDIGADVRGFSQTVFNFLRNTPGIEVIEEFSDIK